ncbi:MAG: helix-turn-helix domain-containing protein [Lachnospiraceae bacterium]|nr:helix-turn-helix domain-containing protein [Lachnospiraceae bacterium]
MDQKKTGSFLKELRKEKALTQEQLAEILGVTNRSISRWENGVNMPDFDLVIELANYFGVSIDEFLNGERKDDMVDKKTEETMLKVADYTNEERIRVTRRLNWIFMAGGIAFLVYMVLEINGLTETGIYEDIASFALGLVLGVMIVGVIYTSRYMVRIKAFKMRLLRRGDGRS